MHRLQQLGPGICRVLSLSVPARAPLSHSGKFCRVEGLKLPLSLPLGPGIQSPAFFTHPLDGNPLLLAPPSLPSTQTTGTGLRRGCFSLKVKSESEVTESCPTLCGLMGSSLHQAPPSMGFSRQEYWSGLPFPSPGNLPNPGIEPRSPAL